MNGFPADVEKYLHRRFVERSRPLLLSFAAGWQLREVDGDDSRFGYRADPCAFVQRLADLFVGLDLSETMDFPFVELSRDCIAHVHWIPAGELGHALILDAVGEHSASQAQQQLGNEASLASIGKSRALAHLRDVRSELERQRSQLEEANALKNALIATLSHEFRTPLTSIFGYLHLLERGIDSESISMQALRALRRNATWLFALAENLLEYARAELSDGLVNPSFVDFSHLREDLDAMFRPLAEDKQLQFSVECAIALADGALFDEVKLRQVAINLLSNAVRYTQQGSIHASMDFDAGHLKLVVRDTGIGIAPELQDRIFLAFNRGAQQGSKGAGLGLSIVKRLVKQMRGELLMESSQGGTCFEVNLPSLVIAAGEAMASTAADSTSPAMQAPRTAIVLDDDPDVAALLEVMLGDLGFHVSIYADAAHTVSAAMQTPPDVLLVDVELSGVSGNAAVYQLRAQGYTGRIVTLSASATQAARSAALSAGADHFLSKPLNLAQFERVMQLVLRRR